MNLRSNIATRIEGLTETQFAYLMLLPALVVTGVLAFFPILWTFDLSLHADTLGAGLVESYVGLKNYIGLITGSTFLAVPFYDLENPTRGAITVNFIIVIGSVSLSMIIGFIEALVLNKAFKGRSQLRVAALLPWAVPVVIQGMIFRLMFTPGVGFGPEIMEWAGMANHEAPLAFSAEGTVVVILAETWRQSAFAAILFLAGLQSIDRDLYKVGEISGATRWEQFKLITFPLVLPTFMIVLIFRTIDALRVFGAIEATAGCRVVPSLACSTVLAFNNHRFGTASAIAVTLAAIVMLFIIVYALYYRSRSNSVGVNI